MAIPVLRRLNSIITSALDEIDARLSSSSLDFPSLDDVYDAARPVEAILVEPDMLTATSLIIAAASQMIASVRHPAQAVIDETFSVHVTSCIRAVIEGDVVEIVRDAGAKGIHCKDIARINGTDPVKTARILRLLANRHIFREVAFDVFALNRTSSLLDTGKAVKVLREKPEEKHFGTTGIPAFLCMASDEIMRGSAFIPEAYTNPKFAHSLSPRETPFNLAFKTSDPVFEWYERPENKARGVRFGIGMIGTNRMGPRDSILAGFDWKSLPAGATVVDVAGGVGSASLTIAKYATHLNVVVQDREAVVLQGKEFWKENYPEALEAGRVRLEARDLFASQPIKDAAAFLLRYIIHDWADPFAKEILLRLREAAAPTTKLVVVDVVVPYTCRKAGTEDSSYETVNKAGTTVPEPLLPSLGAANDMKFFLDMVMYSHFNSQERTATHFTTLAAECGWRVVEVHEIPGSIPGQYVATPI